MMLMIHVCTLLIFSSQDRILATAVCTLEKENHKCNRTTPILCIIRLMVYLCKHDWHLTAMTTKVFNFLSFSFIRLSTFLHFRGGYNRNAQMHVLRCEIIHFSFIPFCHNELCLWTASFYT